MAVTGDTWLPSHFLPDEHDDVLSDNDKNNNHHGSALKPQVQMNDKEEDFIAELTHHMAHFMLQDDDTFDFSDFGSHTRNLELSWDLKGSPKSTTWSHVGSNHGSPEGSSQEPSPPATPRKGMIGMFEKMKLENRGNSKYHHGFEIQSSKSSTIEGLCSYQSLIQEQIRTIELSRHKQEQVVPSPKQNPTTHLKGHGQISQQSQKKGKVGGGNGRRTHPQTQQQQQHAAGSGMQALFLGGSGSRGGTGVFLPRGAPSESTNKQGKGCSTVLIPARVVQALQLHFDKTASMSGPKVVGFPPLRDVLVSNRDGMYSLQKLQSRKVPENVQNEMILPQEWTY